MGTKPLVPFGSLSLFSPLTAHLSREQGLHHAALHEEHVDEVDEHTGSIFRVLRSEDDPLVDNHKDEVAKEAQEEE